LKLVPVTPGPEYVPPTGVAVFNVMGAASSQRFPKAKKLIDGFAFTVILVEAVSLHPFPSVYAYDTA
jgi:hypothetical protein